MPPKKPSVKDLLQTADQAQKAGDPARAQAIYAAILAKFPKHGKAKKELSRLQKITGGNTNRMTAADAQQLGEMLNRGMFAEVLDQVRLLMVHNRKEPFLYNIQGLAQTNLDQNKPAITSFKQAIRLNPAFAEAYNNLGLVHIKNNDASAALVPLKKAISLKPAYAEAHHNLGVALAALEDHAAALAAYNKALELRPAYANALNSRGNLFATMKKYAEATADLKAALQLVPNDAEVISNLGAVLSDLGQAEEAIDYAEKAVQLEPENLDYLASLAVYLNAAGRFDQARARLQELIARQPTHGDAFLSLAGMEKATPDSPLIAQVEAALASKQAEPRDQVRLGFALAKMREDLGQYDSAFEALKAANSLNYQLLEDSDMDRDTAFAAIKQAYSPEAVAALAGQGNPTDVPIFVVGLMRSGTSLVEQILASHSQVYGGGERMFAPDLVKELGIGTGLPTEPQIAEFGTRYVEQLQSLAPQAARVTDKMPANFFHIGLIKLALPNAKIINLVRDPRDNGYSIYKNFFDTEAHRYAYDLQDLARFANQYKSLMAHWHKLFPGQIYDCVYEDLIADQEAQSRKLLEYCALPWEPEVLAFHKTRRAVRTASVNQVRRKIYNSSVRSWEHVAQGLAPYIERLDPDLWAQYLGSGPIDSASLA